jgi:futalosine hydrolase
MSTSHLQQLILQIEFLKTIAVIKATTLGMNIWIIAATDFEIQAAKKVLLNETYENCSVHFLTTSVGMLLSAVKLTQLCLEQKPDLLLQAGVAGSFTNNFPLNSLTIVEQEAFGDLGVVEDTVWKDLFDLKLLSKNEVPFKDGFIINQHIAKWNVTNLPKANAVTVNTITTEPHRIDLLQKKYAAHIETMEGIVFHYVGAYFQIPYLQIRAIYNFVGERNKQNWNLQAAIEQLNKHLEAYVHAINKNR